MRVKNRCQAPISPKLGSASHRVPSLSGSQDRGGCRLAPHPIRGISPSRSPVSPVSCIFHFPFPHERRLENTPAGGSCTCRTAPARRRKICRDGVPPYWVRGAAVRVLWVKKKKKAWQRGFFSRSGGFGALPNRRGNLRSFRFVSVFGGHSGKNACALPLCNTYRADSALALEPGRGPLGGDIVHAIGFRPFK